MQRLRRDIQNVLYALCCADGIPLGVLVLLTVAILTSCTRPTQPELSIPRGYTPVLHFEHDGQALTFGPFVGYYFRPVQPPEVHRLTFVCFNERRFYTRDVPAHAQLFEGTAVLTTLPKHNRSLPQSSRINPVFFHEAPDAWVNSRPSPTNAFLHFHSCYNAAGPVRTGYWFRHVALTNFTYDMGGRLAPDSTLYHVAEKGVDTRFGRIIEFDAGPDQK